MDMVDLNEERKFMDRKSNLSRQFCLRLVVAHGNTRMEVNALCARNRNLADHIPRGWDL